MSKTAVIIVTFNSEKVVSHCLGALAKQNIPADTIYLVDSGSVDPSYLSQYVSMHNLTVLQQENIGFSRANNAGYAQLNEDTDFVLFLNPDVLLDQSFIEKALKVMDSDPHIAIVTGRMIGFNFDELQHSSMLDSTGIFRSWYGRWYDRGQGKVNRNQYSTGEEVQASCGALMFCRKTALDQTALEKNVIFDPDFFLYKEDIELSLRIRKGGWRIRYEPELIAYHGRGWQKNRQKMDRKLRIMAARNEILLYRKHPSPYMLWALAKYFLVTAFNV